MFFKTTDSFLTNQNKKKGFTLLEVLVVLVIVALISTLLLQGFGYSLNLRSKVLRQLGRVQNDELVESWFKRTTSSFVLREKDINAPLFFEGSHNKIHGDSLFSLNQPVGVLKTIEWSLESSSDGYIRLFYTEDLGINDSAFSDDENKTRWEIAKWLETKATFSYLDKDGIWQPHWPTEKYPDELPNGILLNVEKQRLPFFFYSRILGEKKTPSIYRP